MVGVTETRTGVFVKVRNRIPCYRLHCVVCKLFTNTWPRTRVNDETLKFWWYNHSGLIGRPPVWCILPLLGRAESRRIWLVGRLVVYTLIPIGSSRSVVDWWEGVFRLTVSDEFSFIQTPDHEYPSPCLVTKRRTLQMRHLFFIKVCLFEDHGPTLIYIYIFITFLWIQKGLRLFTRQTVVSTVCVRFLFFVFF